MNSVSQEIKTRACPFRSMELPISPWVDIIHDKTSRFAMETLVIEDFFKRRMIIYEDCLRRRLEERRDCFSTEKPRFKSLQKVKDYIRTQELTFVGFWWDDFLVWIIHFRDPMLDASKESREIMANIQAWFRTMIKETTDIFIEAIDLYAWLPEDRTLLKTHMIQVLWRLASMELSQLGHTKKKLRWKFLTTPIETITQTWIEHPHRGAKIGCPALYAGLFKKIISVYLDTYLFPLFDLYSKRLRSELK